MATKKTVKKTTAKPKPQTAPVVVEPTPSTADTVKSKLRWFAKWVLLPCLLYFAFFFIANRQYIGQFSKSFFLDSGDGYQNVWNIWWVHHAVIDLHQNPWFTHYLHVPGGVSLVPQTMNIYNCFVGIVLFGLGMSLVQVVNFAVVFAFVVSGLTMFWLVRYLSKSYIAGLIAGFMFTFSSYHFAHGLGHLQLVTMEWVPLFFLAWWVLLNKPRYRYAVAASLALLLVILSDYYYFFYSVVAAGILLAYFVWRKQITISKQNIRIFGLFAVIVACTSGILVASLLLLNHRDPLVGGHDAGMFSLDALSPLIPGGEWYWNSLTQHFWSPLPYFAETSVYFGSGLIVLLFAALFFHKRLKLPSWVLPWWVIFFSFAILSLGPRLQVDHHVLDRLPLPYAGLQDALPSLKVSGMPIRMIFMALFSGIILAGLVIAKIDYKKIRGMILIGVLAVVSIIDLLPRPLPLTSTSYPAYVDYLKKLPYSYVIDDAAQTGTDSLYYQTIDDKPRAFGYVTRTTVSVNDKDFHVYADLVQGRYNNLCSLYHIRYLTTTKLYPMPFPIIYTGTNGKVKMYIYDLKNGKNC